jgi:hypothetical protein
VISPASVIPWLSLARPTGSKTAPVVADAPPKTAPSNPSAPAKTPPQGRWQIYGIHLPDSILRKVYNSNAARELHITI